MANVIVEYKLDKNVEKGKHTPYWVDEGGMFYNKLKYTYVGVVKDPEIKIPETVVQLSEKDLIDRNLSIHKSKDVDGNSLAFTKLDGTSLQPLHKQIKLTDKEVEEDAKKWYKKNIK